jgi:enamine deaminase RidA (YjgF/YER057c/UK114 family)
MDGATWPVTWVEQGNGEGTPLAGVQAHVMAGVELAPVQHGGRMVGVTYEDEWARYCVLGGLLPPHLQATRKVQAAETMDLMETILRQVDMSFTDVFRTWFYLDDILDWYDEFNDARNRFFKQHGIYDRLVPASTGIGGSNSAGAALVANLVAVVPKSAAFQLTALPSPLQCPALEYGSSFSRAVEIRVPGLQRVLVSGTASIEPGGATTHVGDVEAQVATTMEVIEAILKSRGLDWKDSVRAIAYFKHTDDQAAFGRYCRSRDLPAFPAIVTKNDICRDDLLFELEVDAIRAE